MRDVLEIPFPPNFDDREWLKFLQACKHDIKATGEKLRVHWLWLQSLSPEPLLTPLALKCLQSGCMYIFGRDKYLRPTFVLDCAAINRCHREDPNTVTVETFSVMLTFMVRYMREVMFLPGHVDQWITIMDMDSASLFKLPRQVVMKVGTICQENLMFILHKSYYTAAGLDTRMFYKAVSWAIDPVTK